MAAIDDLIAQIEDKALRERLRMEANRITKEKKFGLVFEEHLPELMPIYSAKVRRHSKVALRADRWLICGGCCPWATARPIAAISAAARRGGFRWMT